MIRDGESRRTLHKSKHSRLFTEIRTLLSTSRSRSPIRSRHYEQRIANHFTTTDNAKANPFYTFELRSGNIRISTDMGYPAATTRSKDKLFGPPQERYTGITASERGVWNLLIRQCPCAIFHNIHPLAVDTDDYKFHRQEASIADGPEALTNLLAECHRSTSRALDWLLLHGRGEEFMRLCGSLAESTTLSYQWMINLKADFEPEIPQPRVIESHDSSSNNSSSAESDKNDHTSDTTPSTRLSSIFSHNSSSSSTKSTRRTSTHNINHRASIASLDTWSTAALPSSHPPNNIDQKALPTSPASTPPANTIPSSIQTLHLAHLTQYHLYQKLRTIDNKRNLIKLGRANGLISRRRAFPQRVILPIREKIAYMQKKLHISLTQSETDVPFESAWDGLPGWMRRMALRVVYMGNRDGIKALEREGFGERLCGGGSGRGSGRREVID